ncbi:GNAT family N-acetyltransferase [Croceicoccus sp. BE223]|uniref:GNAT family N-acetyltransferase n=1 Tax=Croceicoccus sp. BE223 TaxID=2817716 RepID=UPI002858C801|nr:GNAT family N-acetyltransferase [Croceicoccus sp. BE223]MDR7102040.1 putative acetyltransferase [Croceicoccus sp. BE223]
MELVRPTLFMLDEYRAALEAGFTPSNVDPEGSRRDHLAKLADDPAGLLDELHDPQGKGPAFVRPDGTIQPRLPGYTRWMWHDHGFAGAINLRWQPGTAKLPPGVPGHVGYVVDPRHRGRGFATQALRAIAAEARAMGLPHIDLTAQDDNLPSVRTIEKAGGQRVGPFDADAHHPCAQSTLWRIVL